MEKNIQKDDIDRDLKNSLWNGIYLYYWRPKMKQNYLFSSENEKYFTQLLIKIWTDFFKNQLDKMPTISSTYLDELKKSFFNCKWNQIYDLIEFVILNYKTETNNNTTDKFINYCNEVLEREVSAYRVINRIFAPIISKEEIVSIEEALTITDNFTPVQTHLKRALELYSDREKPDYRNSIKESISAVESYCSLLTKDPKATLGQALKQIEKENNLHSALKDAFSKLYGYTSDENGIRHALLEEENLFQEDANFMLVACSAFINYLRQKEAKAST